MHIQTVGKQIAGEYGGDANDSQQKPYSVSTGEYQKRGAIEIFYVGTNWYLGLYDCEEVLPLTFKQLKHVRVLRPFKFLKLACT